MSKHQGHMTKSESSGNSADLAEIHGDVPSGLGQLLWHILLATATKYPDRDAIVAMHGSSGNSGLDVESPAQRWSYQDLLSRANVVAHRLGHLGCGGAGNNLVVMTRNIAEWGLFFWVAAKTGMAFVPLDPSAKDDLAALLSTAAPQVLVVEDCEMADKVESAALQNKKPQLARIVISGDVRADWLSLRQLQDASSEFCRMGCQFNHLRAGGTGSPALILFTSGTTGTPKACIHSQGNIVSQTHDYDPNPDPAFVDKWLVHTPVHHILAINNALRAWRMGGAVILPSPTFSVKASLHALVREQCTIMSATPALIKAMLAEKGCPDARQLSLSVVSLASTMISPEDIRLCRQSLGCRNTIQAYGMSESGPVISWCRRDPLLIDGFHRGVGKVLPGASIRICHPDTRDILCVGDVGELHISGPSVISGYTSEAANSSFYMDQGRRWLVTGDQARVDGDGVVYIMGRYKDLIIRGGENIDPATIEKAIAALSNIEVQVVGSPDSLAGEIPVAVVKRHGNISNSAIFERARSLGPKYTLGAIYDISQLSYEDMPVTSLKKPRRQLLKAALARFMKASEESQQLRHLSHSQTRSATSEQSALAEKLASIWDELCGVRPGPQQSVHAFADSILLLQYCDRVFRLVQTPLYLQDLFDHESISSQASLLIRRQSGGMLSPQPASGSLAEMAAVPKARVPMNMECSRGWRDVAAASVLPSGVAAESVISLRVNQYRMVEGQRPQSYHIRLAYRIQALPGARIRDALRALLSKTPLLRSVLFKSTTACAWQHGLCGENLVEHLLHEGQAAAENEARASLSKQSSSSLALPYVFRADVIRCLDTGSHMLVMHFNHAVVDALSLWSTLRNLDDLLQDLSSALPGTVPYALWAEQWHQNRTNALARSAVTRLASRLRGISRFPDALWPPQRAPGWQIGGNDGSSSCFPSSSSSSSTASSTRRQVREAMWNGTWEESSSSSAAKGDAALSFPRRGRVVRLPHLAALQSECGIAPDVVARCALIAFNTSQTGSPYAVFTSWEAARSWPFVAPWMQGLLPPAMAVDGPTTQWRLNMYRGGGGGGDGTGRGGEDETVLAFLERIRQEEAALAEHAHAPWDDVKAALGEEEGCFAEDASFHQGFVWDVTLGMSAQSKRQSTYKLLEPISRHDWPDCGIFWNAFMVDKENMYFLASWDTAQLSSDEIDHYCERLAEVLRALTNTANRHRLLRQVLPIL